MTTAANERICPFEMGAKFCEYQGVRCKDLVTAIVGDLVYLCLLGKTTDCPKMKDMLEEDE